MPTSRCLLHLCRRQKFADFAPGWLTPSQNSISERSPSSPPEKSQCEVLQREYDQKLKIAGIVTIIGGSIAKTIAGTQVKYRDYQDSNPGTFLLPPTSHPDTLQ